MTQRGRKLPLPSVVLFDLDGTLSNSAPGILASLRHALAVNGVPPLDPLTERSLLGPPFYESLPPLIGSVPLLSIVAAYRKFYGAGAMYDTSVYDGLVDVLDELRTAGVRMAVATSKPEPFAVPIVERLGLAGYFETVGGDDLRGSRATKALVVAEVLARMGRPGDAVLVGDRVHDIVGARVHGLPCVAVRWGNALPGELEGAGPAAVCATPAGLVAALRSARGAAGQ